jgi:hypothetical protein
MTQQRRAASEGVTTTLRKRVDGFRERECQRVRIYWEFLWLFEAISRATWGMRVWLTTMKGL